jgi:hypothetical protein
MAEARRSVIAGSRSFGAPLAALSRFLLAAMRKGVPLAMLVGWRCLISDDNGSFLDAARVLLEPEGLSVVGLASTLAEAPERAEEPLTGRGSRRHRARRRERPSSE